MIRKGNLSDETGNATISGPAVTHALLNGQKFDGVMSLAVKCSAILQDWLRRPRKYEWPAISLRQAACNINGNLIPVGIERSETKHLERRYCFNEFELLIFASLNDTQVKLYRMLKMINTDVLQQKKHNFIYVEKYRFLVSVGISTVHVSTRDFNQLDKKSFDYVETSCSTELYSLLHDS